MKFPFWPRNRRDEHLRQEIEGHLQMATRDRIDRGESPEEARHAAHRKLGNAHLVRGSTVTSGCGEGSRMGIENSVSVPACSAGVPASPVWLC